MNKLKVSEELTLEIPSNHIVYTKYANSTELTPHQNTTPLTDAQAMQYLENIKNAYPEAECYLVKFVPELMAKDVEPKTGPRISSGAGKGHGFAKCP